MPCLLKGGVFVEIAQRAVADEQACKSNCAVGQLSAGTIREPRCLDILAREQSL